MAVPIFCGVILPLWLVSSFQCDASVCRIEEMMTHVNQCNSAQHTTGTLSLLDQLLEFKCITWQ